VSSGRRRRGWWRGILLFILTFCLGLYLLCLTMLLSLRWVNPPVTMVQMQRRLEAGLSHRSYQRRQVWMPLDRISPSLEHAVIAAEDGRFFEHHGIDWKEVQKVVDRDVEEGRIGRGGSTITQQLVKNLFFTTSRSFLRKAVEFTLAPPAEWFLPKRRILELYLNVIEWGPGVYGAESAAQYWYQVSAARLTREQSARLAAIIPNPIRRRPGRMNAYTEEILRRMAQMGW
jgi:monofunctional biosynthetic peptidoglycan transglycosylase